MYHGGNRKILRLQAFFQGLPCVSYISRANVGVLMKTTNPPLKKKKPEICNECDWKFKNTKRNDRTADCKNLNKFGDHDSLVDSSAHGFERDFIGPFLLKKQTQN